MPRKGAITALGGGLVLNRLNLLGTWEKNQRATARLLKLLLKNEQFGVLAFPLSCDIHSHFVTAYFWERVS